LHAVPRGITSKLATASVTPAANSIAAAAVAPAELVPSDEATLRLIRDVYRYRHLLRNLRALHEQRKREEREEAPKIKGPRAAAVLARLWATEDLSLPSASQKVLGVDLGIAPSEIGKILKHLRSEKPGPPCVTLVSDQFDRENIYEITDEGKRQLTQWLFFHIAPGPYRESANAILKEIDPLKIAKFVELLKNKAKELLKH